jgi:chromosome segregation ATPase
VNDVRENGDIAISIRRALDEQTDQVFALTERISYLTLVEDELRGFLTESQQLLLARDAEILQVRQEAQLRLDRLEQMEGRADELQQTCDERLVVIQNLDQAARERLELINALTARCQALEAQAGTGQQNAELEQLRQQVQQRDAEQATALKIKSENDSLRTSLAIAQKVLRDIRKSRIYRVTRRAGRWASVERDMRRFFGK